MVALDELGAQDISFVADHVVVFLLFGLLLLGRLDDLLHVVDMVFLILDDLFVGLDHSLGPVLVRLDLHIFGLHFFVIFIELHQFLVLVLDLFPQLFDSIGHSFVLFL